LQAKDFQAQKGGKTFMKRDMDCFRAVLLKIEELPSYTIMEGTEVEGYSAEQIAYHIKLAQDAGFIVARSLVDQAAIFMVERLTFAGTEFLEAAKDDTLWQKAKQTVVKNTGTLTVEALKITLAQLIQNAARGIGI
jgi:hypothetical protein